MGFRVGACAKLWQVERHEKYDKVKMTISHKNKQTGVYEKDFSGYTSFLGNAHAQRPLDGQTIRITDCDVTVKPYTNPQGQTTYKTSFIVYGYELQGGEQPTQTVMDLNDLESNMPF